MPLARMALEVAFIKRNWEIVRNDVCKSVMRFFEQSWHIPNMNSNIVVLILKVPSADKIEDFRPIALEEFQFKIMTKVLVDICIYHSKNHLKSAKRFH